MRWEVPLDEMGARWYSPHMPKLTRKLMNEKEYARFLTYVKKDEATGCWVWQGAHGGSGMYAQFSIERAQIRAHMASYIYHKGEYEDGLQLDHLCFNRSCVNPEHLEPVTAKVNMQRARARLTHCKQGHPFDEENTYMTKDGHRECKECRREATRKWRRGE